VSHGVFVRGGTSTPKGGRLRIQHPILGGIAERSTEKFTGCVLENPFLSWD